MSKFVQCGLSQHLMDLWNADGMHLYLNFEQVRVLVILCVRTNCVMWWMIIYTEGKWHERRWDVKRHAIRVKKISLAWITVPWHVVLVLRELFIVFGCSTLHFKTLIPMDEAASCKGDYQYIIQYNFTKYMLVKKSEQCGF